MTREELYDDIVVSVIAAFSVRCDLDPKTLKYEDKIHDLVDGDKFLLGHILLDIHEHYNLELQYEPLEEPELFKTVLDVVEYFEKHLNELHNL